MRDSKVTVGGNVRWKSVAFVMLATTLIGLLLVSGGANLARAETNPQTYDNVQVLVHTTDTFSGTYVISAYNSSGSLVAWSQSKYPTSSFELPNGRYLFTANAFQQDYYGCYPYPLSAAASGSVASGAPTNGNPTVMPPCRPYNPKIEYGYSTEQISGSTTLNISTEPLSQSSFSRLVIHVRYANGTAASDASISAFVVGATNWWGSGAGNLTMYAQTGQDGTAKLIVPSVPVEVAAWTALPVNLPKNLTTVQTIVAGEKVNVTVYWQPTYIDLGASALILPPDKSADMTLHFQQPSYWAMPYMLQGAGASVAGTGSFPGIAGGMPFPSQQAYSNYAGTATGAFPGLHPQISPLQTRGAAIDNSGLTALTLLTVAVGAIALASISLALTVRLKRDRGSNRSV